MCNEISNAKSAKEECMEQNPEKTRYKLLEEFSPGGGGVMGHDFPVTMCDFALEVLTAREAH